MPSPKVNAIVLEGLAVFQLVIAVLIEVLPLKDRFTEFPIVPAFTAVMVTLVEVPAIILQ